ncbi:hypothetical protein B0H13DRAFT_2302384 [Mycena leptocephala]|nr:hypothetical protein B0H13DRAFT_2302384 [Mycena leptocephala]
MQCISVTRVSIILPVSQMGRHRLDDALSAPDRRYSSPAARRTRCRPSSSVLRRAHVSQPPLQPPTRRPRSSAPTYLIAPAQRQPTHISDHDFTYTRSYTHLLVVSASSMLLQPCLFDARTQTSRARVSLLRLARLPAGSTSLRRVSASRLDSAPIPESRPMYAARTRFPADTRLCSSSTSTITTSMGVLHMRLVLDGNGENDGEADDARHPPLRAHPLRAAHRRS